MTRRFKLSHVIWLVVSSYSVFALLMQTDFFAYDFKRILQCLILGAVLPLALVGKRITIDFIPKKVWFLLWVIFIMGLIGVIYSGYRVSAILEWVYCLVWGISLLALVSVLDDLGWSVRVFAVFCVVALGVYQVQFLAGYVSAMLNGLPFSAKILFFNVSHIRFFNQYQVIVTPILFWLSYVCVSEGKPKLGALVYLILIVSWAMLGMASARGALLALFASLFLFFCFSGAAFRKVLLVYSSSILAGFLLFYLIQYAIPDLFGVESETVIYRTGDTGRSALWAFAVQLWVESPIWGVGPAQYARADNGYLIAHPHNVVLQVLSEWGGVCALILLLAMAKLFVRSCLQIRSLSGPSNISREVSAQLFLLMSLLASGFYSMLSGVHVMPLSQFSLLLCVVLLLKFRLMRAKTQKAPSISIRGEWLLFPVAVWACLLVYTYLSLPENGEPFFNFGPRIWRIGYAQ